MKKGIVGLIGLASLLTLAACNIDGSRVKDPYGRGVWGVDLVEKNIEEEKAIAKKDETYYLTSNVGFKSTEIVDSTYASRGLLVVKNDEGYLGFYSINHGSYLAKPQFIPDALQYGVYTDQNVGYFLVIAYDDILTAYDSLGNVLFQTTKFDDLHNVYNRRIEDMIKTSYINNKVYITVNFDTVKYYEYTDQGSLNQINSLPQTQAVVEENTTTSFAKDSKYIDIEKEDLKDYGLEGYYLSKKGELVTVFETKTNTAVSTFTVPSGANIVFVSDKLIYQNAYVVSDDENNYSFFDGRNKYVIETYSVNLLNGDKTALDISYLIGEVYGPYKDQLGVYSYALISKKSFENKVLKSDEIVIIDSKGAIIGNLNGYEPNSFVKIGSGYYNTKTKVLYDSKLKEIAYLAAINPTMYKEYNCFIGTINGKYGAVNAEGTVIIPFEYTELNHIKNDKGYMFGIKNKQLYRVNMNGTEEAISSDYTKINDSIYITHNDSNQYSIHSARKTLKANIEAENFSLIASLSTNLYSTNVIRFVESSINSKGLKDYSYSYYNVTKDVAANYSQLPIIGNEKLDEIQIGKKFEDAQSLKLGENMMYLTQNSGNYFKFTPEKDGFYNIPSYYKDQYSVNVDAYEYNPDNQNQITDVTTSKETYGNIVRLYAGKTYYFLVSSTYTNKGAINLEFKVEEGNHAKYPAIHSLTDNAKFRYFEGGTYVQINAKGGGYYKASKDNSTNVVYTTTYNPARPTGYNVGYSLRDEAIDGTTYYLLDEFTSYEVLLQNNTYEEGDYIPFALYYDKDNEEYNPVGSSIINPFIIYDNEEVNYSNLNYYKYHVTKDCALRFSATDPNVFNSNSSYARIYIGEYNPVTNSEYLYVQNGETISAKAGDDIYIRINRNVISNITDFTLNIEEISSDDIDTGISLNEYPVTGNDYVYHFKPTTSGLYTITLDAKKDDYIVAYDLYNRKIGKVIADRNRKISFSHYFQANSVYQISGAISSDSATRVLTINRNTTVSDQYLIEGKLNTTYFDGNTTFVFTPQADGVYSFKADGNKYLNSFNIYDLDSNYVEWNMAQDTYNVYTAKLEANKTYKITMSAYSNGKNNIEVTREYGQNWYAPMEITPLKEVDLTSYLKALGVDEAEIYVKMYFPKEAAFNFTGLSTIGTSSANAPTSPLSGTRIVTEKTTYYFMGEVDKDNKIIKTELYDSSVEEASSIYKPAKVELSLSNQSNKLSGFTPTPNTSRYFEMENTLGADIFVIFGEATSILEIKVYDEEYKEIYMTEDKVFALKSGDKAYIEIISSDKNAYSQAFTIATQASYELKDSVADLSDRDKIIDYIVADIKYVKIHVKNDDVSKNAKVKILDSKGNVLEEEESELGFIEFHYTFKPCKIYKIVIEGDAKFSINYSYNPIMVKNGDFENYNEEYRSINPDINSEKSMTIKVFAPVDLSFDVITSCADMDYVKIVRTRGTDNRNYDPIYASSSNPGEVTKFSAHFEKGDIITISYIRSAHLPENDNEVIITNIKATVAESTVV